MLGAGLICTVVAIFLSSLHMSGGLAAIEINCATIDKSCDYPKSQLYYKGVNNTLTAMCVAYNILLMLPRCEIISIAARLSLLLFSPLVPGGRVIAGQTRCCVG